MSNWLTRLAEHGKRATVWTVILCFTVSLIAPQAAYAQAALMPQPGTRVQLSPVFTPPIITGLQLSPDDPLQINFLIDTGDNRVEGPELSAASQKLINYFFAALTVPEDEMWVNLSPYEKNKIIAGPLSHTAMGRDMLAQDYLLKQLSASMLYPEDELGRRFWQRVQHKAQQQFGTTEIPLNTFNKIWIIPQRAQVYVNGENVFIADSHLKVMLEEDYLALQQHTALEDGAAAEDVVTGVSDEVVREVLIPEIEREINTGENFAPLRQIFHSLILATWYKRNLRDSLLGRVYINRNKVGGIEIEEENVKEEIYQQYLTALQKGVFDYIREDQDPRTGEPIPRRYFSGGVDMAQLSAEIMTEGMTEKLRTAAVTRTFHTVETYAGLRHSAGEDALDAAMMSDAADRLEVKKREYTWTPEREENERQAERRAAIEIRQRLGLLHGEAETLMTLRRQAATEDELGKVEKREQQLLEGMRRLYQEMPVQIVSGKDYEFYSQALQDLKRDRRLISAQIRAADAIGDKKRVGRLNQLAIRNNRLLVKTQLLVAGRLQTGQSRDGIRHPTPALNALEGAINSASALEIELEYRIQRLRGQKFRRVIETQDWVGNRVRTYRLGAFDIDIEKPQEGEDEPKVTVRQKRPVNVHTRLDRIRRQANKGEVSAAVRQINYLLGIYKLRYLKTLETYTFIERDLLALRDVIQGLPEGTPLAKGEVKDEIQQRVTDLVEHIQFPKQMVWDNVTYRSRRKAFEGQIRKIASELAEYMVILKNKTDLDYYAKKIARARQRQEQGRRVTLSQRDRVIITEKLEELQQWTERGFVEPKISSSIDFAPIIELIGRDEFKRAEQHLVRIIERLDKRLADIERITTHLKDSAASLFAEFRRDDIIRRAEEIIETLNEEEFGPALELVNDLEDDYFQFDHPEPGLVRAGQRLKEARHILSGLKPESVMTQATADELYEIIWKMKEDAQHPTQFRVDVVNEKGQNRVYYPAPGISVQGFLNIGRRDSRRTIVVLNGQTVPRNLYEQTRLTDNSRVELRRDEAMIAIDDVRLGAALTAARTYTESYNARFTNAEPLKIRVQLNHETLVRWDTDGSQEGLLTFVKGKLARANPTNEPGEVSIRTEANHVFITWHPDNEPDLLGPDDGLGGDAAMLSAADRIRLLYGIKAIHDTLSANEDSADALIERGEFLDARGEQAESSGLRLWQIGTETIDAKQIHLTRSLLEYLAEQLGLATLYRVKKASIQPRAEAPYLWLLGTQVVTGMYLELPQPGDGERDLNELVSRARSLTETLMATISLSLPREAFGRTAADNAVLAQLAPDTDILTDRLEDGALGLSTRVINILKLNRIETVGHLTQLSLHNLRGIPNIGTAGRQEIIAALNSRGLSLRTTAFVRSPSLYQINEIVLEAYANTPGPRHRRITVEINGEPVEYTFADRGAVDTIGLDIYNRIQESLADNRDAFSIRLDDTRIQVRADAALLAEDDDLQAWLEQRGVPEPEAFLDNLAWLRQISEPQLKLADFSLTILRDTIISNLIYGHPLDVLAVEKVGRALQQYRDLIETQPDADLMKQMKPFVVGKAKESLENRIRYMILNNDQRRLAKALLQFDGTNIGEVINILNADPYDYHTDISREELREFYHLLTPLIAALPVTGDWENIQDSPEAQALISSRIGRLVEQLYEHRAETADLLLRYIVDEFSALKLILQGDNLAHLSRYTEDEALLGGAPEEFDLSRLQRSTVTGAEQVLEALSPHFPQHPGLKDRTEISRRIRTWFEAQPSGFSGNIVAVVSQEGATEHLGYLDENIARLFDLPYVDADAAMLVDAVHGIAQHLNVPEKTVATAIGEALSVTQVLVRWDVLANDLDVPQTVRTEISQALEKGLDRYTHPYDAAGLTRLIFETEAAYTTMLPTSSRRDMVVTLTGAPGLESVDYPIGLLRSLFYILGSSVDWRYFAELIEQETGLSQETVQERLDEMVFRFIYAPYVKEYVTVNGMVIATKMRFPSFADFVNYQRGSRPEGRLINRGTPLEIVTRDDPRRPVKTVFERLDDDVSPSAVFTTDGFFDGSIIKEITYTDYSITRDMAMFGKRKKGDEEKKGLFNRRRMLIAGLILAGLSAGVVWHNLRTIDSPTYDMTPAEATVSFYDMTYNPTIEEVRSLLNRGRPVPAELLHQLHRYHTETQGILERETKTPSEEAAELRAYMERKESELGGLISRAERNIAPERTAADYQETLTSLRFRYRALRVVNEMAPQTAKQAIDQVLVELNSLRTRMTAAESETEGMTPLIDDINSLIRYATEFQQIVHENAEREDNGMLASQGYTPEILAGWLEELITEEAGGSGRASGFEQMAGRLLLQIARTKDLDETEIPADLRQQLTALRDAAVLADYSGESDYAAFAEMTVPVTEQSVKLESPIELRVQIIDGEVQVDTGDNTKYADYAAVLIDELEYHLSRPDTDPAVLEQISDLRVIITTDTTDQYRDTIINKLPLAANGNPLIAHSSISKKAVTVHPYFFDRKSAQLRRLLFTHEVISRIGKQTSDQEEAVKNTHDYLREEFAAAELDIPELLRINREQSQPEKVFLADIRRQRNYRSGLNDIPAEQASNGVKDAVLAATQFLELFAASTDKFNFNGIAAREELAEHPELVVAFGRYLANEMSADEVAEVITASGAAWAGTVFANALQHVKSSNIFSTLRKDYDPVTLVIDADAITSDKRVVDYVFSYRPGYFYALTEFVDRNNGTGSLAQGGIRFKPLQWRGPDGKLQPEDKVAYNHFQTAFAEVDMISRSKFARNTVTQTPYSGAKTIMTVFPDSKNIKSLLLKSLARSYVDAGVTSRYIIGTESGLTGKDQDTLAQAIGTRYRDHLRHELEQIKTLASVGEDLSKIKSTSQYGKYLRTIETEHPEGGRFLHDPLMDALRQRVVASMHLGQQNGGVSLTKLFSSRLEADIARTIGAAATGRFTDKELNALKEWSLTAFSAAMSIEAIDEYMPERDLRNRKIGIRGATAGGSLALMLTRMGYQVVAIEDINGTVYKKEGFTVAELQRLDNIALNERNVLRWLPEEAGQVQHLPKGALGDKDRMDLDILISAAPGHHLDGESVDRMRGLDDEPGSDPLIYVEAGFNSINGFEKELHRKGILAFKATSIGFGGAYGSYLEDYIKHRFTTEQLRRIVLRSGDTDIVTTPETIVNDRFTVTNATGTDTLGEVVLEGGRVVYSTLDDISIGMNLDLLDGQLYSQGIRMPYKHRDLVKTLIWDNFRVTMDGQGKILKSNHPDLPPAGRALFIDPVQEIRLTAYQDIKGIAKRMNTMVMELARYGGTPGKKEFRMTPTQAIKRITKLISDKKRSFETTSDERITEAIQTIVDKLETDGFFFPANVARKIAVKRLVSSSDLSIQIEGETFYFNAEGRLVRSPETDSEDAPGHVRMNEALSGSFDFSLKSARQAESSLRAQETRSLEAQHFIGLDKRLRTTDAGIVQASQPGSSMEEQLLATTDAPKRETRPEAVRYLESQRAQKTNRAGLDDVLPNVQPRRRDILLGAATFLEILSHYELKHSRGEYFDGIGAIQELVAHPDIAAAMIEYVDEPAGNEEIVNALIEDSGTTWLKILFERGIKNITSTSADVVQPEKGADTSGGNREAIAIRFNGVPMTGVENKKELVFIYLPGRFYAITQLVDLSTAEHTKGGIRYAEPVARPNDPQKRNVDEVAYDIMTGAYEDLNNLSVSQYSKNVLAGIGYAGAKTYFGVHQDATSLKDDLLRSWARAMVDVGLMEVYDGGPDVGMSSANQETIIEGIVRRYTLHLMNEVRTLHAHGVDVFNLNLSTYGKALAEIEKETGQRFLDDSLIGYMRKRLLLQLPKGKENGSVIVERVFNRKLKDEIVKIIGSAVTGGSAKVGAISHVELAVTGDSTLRSIEAILEYKGLDPKNLKAAVVGAGDVGGSVALKMARLGITVVGISDINGAVHKPAGFTVEELQNLNTVQPGDRNVLEWLPVQDGVEHLKGMELLDKTKVDIDLLVPAAMGGLINPKTLPLLRTAEDDPDREPLIIIEGSNNAFVGMEETLKSLGILAVSGMSVNFGGVKGSTKEAMLKHLLTVRELRTITLRDGDGKVIPTAINTEVTERIRVESDENGTELGTIVINNGNVVASDIEEISIGSNLDPLNGRLYNRGDDLGYKIGSLQRRLAWDNYVVIQQGYGTVTASNHPDITVGHSYEYVDPLDQIKIELYAEIEQIARRNNTMVMELSTKFDMTPTEAVVRLARALGQRKADIYAATEGEDMTKRDAIVSRFKKEKFFMADHIMRNIAAIQVAMESNLSLTVGDEQVTFDAKGFITDKAMTAETPDAETPVSADVARLNTQERHKILTLIGAKMIDQGAEPGMTEWLTENNIAEATRLFRQDGNFAVLVHYNSPTNYVEILPAKKDEAALAAVKQSPLTEAGWRAEMTTLIGAKMIEQGAEPGLTQIITAEHLAEARRLYQRDGNFYVKVRYNPVPRIEIEAIAADQALTADPENPGGIDFNTGNMDLQVQGGGVEYPVPVVMPGTVNPAQIQGLQPVIINITPLPNLIPLLGLHEERKDGIQSVQQDPRPEPAPRPRLSRTDLRAADPRGQLIDALAGVL